MLWYDENEVLVVEECKAYYARVKAALPGGKVPNRRLLFAQLESGTAPAGSLMQFHVKELRRLVGNHPEADVPITCEVFVSEWLEIIAELQNMVFEAEPKEEKDDADEEGAGTAGKLFGVMKTLGLSAGDEEEEYTTSEEDDERYAFITSVFYPLTFLPLQRRQPDGPPRQGCSTPAGNAPWCSATHTRAGSAAASGHPCCHARPPEPHRRCSVARRGRQRLRPVGMAPPIVNTI